MLEHLEQEKRKKLMSGRKTRPPYASLLDKTELKEQKESQLKEMTIASVPRDPEPIPDAYYTDPVDITTLSSLQQMYIDPAHQPKTCSEYWPQPLQLISKKIHRCKGCDHILLKSDVNLNTVRFKLQHIALYVFPRIRLLHSPNLTLNEPSIIPVSIVSPVNVNYDVTLSFGHYIGKIKDILSPLILPEGSFVLRSSDDDMSDILDDSAKSSTEENMFILSSEPGRLVLKFVVIPQSTEIDTKIAFVVNFTYQPLVEVENDESSADNTLRVPVMINCGHSFS
jgi:dynactin-4